MAADAPLGSGGPVGQATLLQAVARWGEAVERLEQAVSPDSTVETALRNSLAGKLQAAKARLSALEEALRVQAGGEALRQAEVGETAGLEPELLQEVDDFEDDSGPAGEPAGEQETAGGGGGSATEAEGAARKTRNRLKKARQRAKKAAAAAAANEPAAAPAALAKVQDEGGAEGEEEGVSVTGKGQGRKLRLSRPPPDANEDGPSRVLANAAAEREAADQAKFGGAGAQTTAGDVAKTATGVTARGVAAAAGAGMGVGFRGGGLVLGYWDTRGLAHDLRAMLAHAGVAFEDRRYTVGDVRGDLIQEIPTRSVVLMGRRRSVPRHTDRASRCVRSRAIASRSGSRPRRRWSSGHSLTCRTCWTGRRSA